MPIVNDNNRKADPYIPFEKKMQERKEYVMKLKIKESKKKGK